MTGTKNNRSSKGNNDIYPPGRVKIREAIKTALEKKPAREITWPEIAETAGVSQALIYKYYGNVENLLHEVMHDYAEEFLESIEYNLKGIEDPFSKLRKLIWTQINHYNEHRALSRVFLNEIRSFSGFFASPTFELVKVFGRIIREIIEDGIQKKVIRSDVPSRQISELIVGCMDTSCWPNIVTGREINPDEMTEIICKVIFQGIRNVKET